MKTHFTNILNRLGKYVLMLMLVVGMASCDKEIFDYEDNCDPEEGRPGSPDNPEKPDEPVYFVEFVFDLNMQFDNTFKSQVTSVDLYVFNTSGQFIKKYHEDGAPLKETGYRMKLTDLSAGEYNMIAWCGLYDEYFTIPAAVVQSHELTARMKVNQGEPDYSDVKLAALFHGMTPASVTYTDEAVEQTHTINLTKDTNDITITLQYHNLRDFGKNRFRISIYDRNGFMRSNNEVPADNAPVEYRPHETKYDDTSVTENGQTLTGKYLKVDFTTSRLIYGHEPTLSIIDTHNADKEIFAIPLIKWILQQRNAAYKDMDEQEYLDRQDSYAMRLWLDDPDPTVEEPEPEPDPDPYYVRFEFTKHLKHNNMPGGQSNRVDLFGSQVTSVDLYVFDDRGLFVKRYHDEGESLAQPGYLMELTDLPAGNYRMIAWCGATNNENFAIPAMTEGEHYSELTATLDAAETSDEKLAALFHGSNNLKATYTDDDERICTVSLTKDTNDVGVTLQYKNLEQFSESRFRVTITDNNGFMRYDNSVPDKNPYLGYLPYYTDYTSMTAEVNGETKTGNILLSEFTTARLMADHDDKAMLNVIDTENGDKVIYSASLIGMLLQQRPSMYLGMDEQLYLDCEDTYKLAIYIDDTVAEPEPEKPQPKAEYYVEFEYTLNMQYADLFGSKVNSVKLYVFDKDGKLVGKYSENGSALAEKGYRMKLEGLEAGSYNMVAWCGLNNNDNFADSDIEEGSRLSDLTAKLNAEDISDSELKALFHGMTPSAVTYTAERVEQTYVVSLTKDTNDISVSLRYKTPQSFDANRFRVTITDNNGFMHYDNSVPKDNRNIEYRPHSTSHGTVPESGVSNSLLQVDIATARLMAEGHNPVIRVVDTENDDEVVYEASLVSLLLQNRPPKHAGMPAQEYFDREDTYSLTILLDNPGPETPQPEAEYYVEFEYTLNMQYADLFGSKVNSVDLYVFDESWRLVRKFSEAGSALSKNGYRMKLEGLEAGSYNMVAWCGLNNNDNFIVNDNIVDAQYLTATLTTINNTSGSNLTALFHGMRSAVTYTAERVEQTHVVSLTKDTNDISVSLRYKTLADFNSDRFRVTIADNNGFMLYDNSVPENNSQVEYLHYRTSYTTLRENSVSGGLLRVDIATARLMAEGHNPVIRVVDTENGDEVVYEASLVDLLLQNRPPKHAGMPAQEYFDREDTYSLTILLDNPQAEQPDPEQRYYVKFEFERNMQFADAFNQTNVKSVDLYVFDSASGQLVKQYDLEVADMTDNRYRVDVTDDLEAGKAYEMIAWCHGAEKDGTFTIPQRVTGYTDPTATLNAVNRTSDKELTALFHGMNTHTYTADADECLISLTKDTNDIFITLQHTRLLPFGKNRFVVRMTDNNGYMLYDNSLPATNPVVTYNPYYTEYGELKGAVGGVETTGNYLKVNLSTARLMAEGHNPVIKVIDTENGDKEIFSIPLVKWVLLNFGSSKYKDRIKSQQEYLDREDSYNLMLWLDSYDQTTGEDEGWFGASIVINDWHVVDDSKDLQ